MIQTSVSLMHVVYINEDEINIDFINSIVESFVETVINQESCNGT